MSSRQRRDRRRSKEEHKSTRTQGHKRREEEETVKTAIGIAAQVYYCLVFRTSGRRLNTSHRAEQMEGRGLTLRSKTRRPQISAPKPISGPVPSNNSQQSTSNGSPAPRPNREKPQQSGATSDLVKRRYSTRYNHPPDFNAGAPPMPGVPNVSDGYGTPPPPDQGAATSATQPIRVDLNALRDPSLPADKCEHALSPRLGTVTNHFTRGQRRGQSSCQCIRTRYP